MRQAGILAAVAVAVLAGCVNGVETGAASYAQLCAGCHGAGGKGDGPNAMALTVKPADLTQISSRNGGTFPRLAIMAKIDGYAKGKPHYGAMPAFWPLLEGKTVMVDAGDGVLTPTPERLVALADYLEGLQQ